MLSDKAKETANEVKRKGLWLYDPSYKHWYTPEEFTHIFHYANADDRFLDQLKIMHPLEGMEAGFKKLLDTQTKLNLFTKKVFDYYKSH